MTYCKDFLFSGVRDEQLLREDAAFCVVLVVARVSLCSCVVDITRSEGTRLDRIQRVAADRLDLFCELEGDRLVSLGSPWRSRVLVLRKSRNLRVRSLERSTRVRLFANCPSVPFERAEDERVDHTVDIPGRFRIRERLVSGRLLQAFDILDIPLAFVRRGVSEQTKHWVHNLVWVIEVQGRSHNSERGFMRVFWEDSSVALRGGDGDESIYKPCGTSRFQGSGLATTEETRSSIESVNMMNGNPGEIRN